MQNYKKNPTYARKCKIFLGFPHSAFSFWLFLLPQVKSIWPIFSSEWRQSGARVAREWLIDRSESEPKQDEVSGLFRITVQRYDEEIGFCKFFRKKMPKNAFLWFFSRQTPRAPDKRQDGKLHKLQNCISVSLDKILIIII